MENILQDAISAPVSPAGQLLSNSVLSLSVIAVLETDEVPFDDSRFMSMLRNVFLHINPRFASIIVTNEDGEQRWKRVEVRVEDHVNVPVFPAGMSPGFYDKCLDDYLSKITMENLPQSRPLWETHIIKYPTSRAAGNVIFKLHHSLGDGFSLMGALLCCFQRADNPSLPLTLPSVKLHANKDGENFSMRRTLHKIFSTVYNTTSDFSSSILKSWSAEDDETPIRSGQHGAEFLPVGIETMTFSLDHIKQIKSTLGATLNDVITGTIFLGTRLYMESLSPGSGSANSSSLVLMNTRVFAGYKSIEEMMKPNAELPWGNHFTFLTIPLPKLRDGGAENPLQFVFKAREIIKRKRMNTFAVFLNAKYLQLVSKFRGVQGASKYIRGTMMNTSMGITNVMGPIEQMAVASHPVKGIYFVVSGAPQSLMVGVISYAGKLRVALMVEKDFIDPRKLKSHVEHAFDLIFKASCSSRTPPLAN